MRVYLQVLVYQHQGPLGISWSEEAADQGGPAQRELKLYVFLVISTECGPGPVIAEVKLPVGDQKVDLALNR